MSRKIYELFAGEEDSICPLLKEIMPAQAAGRRPDLTPQPENSIFNQGIGVQFWPELLKKIEIFLAKSPTIKIMLTPCSRILKV